MTVMSCQLINLSQAGKQIEGEMHGSSLFRNTDSGHTTGKYDSTLKICKHRKLNTLDEGRQM